VDNERATLRVLDTQVLKPGRYTSVRFSFAFLLDDERYGDFATTTKELRSFDTARLTRRNRLSGFQIDQNNKLVGPNAMALP
jgi:hypothetical protein